MQQAQNTLPCGGRIVPDPNGEFPINRCDTCFAVIGSIGQPKRCQELMEKQEGKARAKEGE